jgi:Transcription termination factor nusG
MHFTKITSPDSVLSSPNWYALYTKHQHEKAVARNLTSKGFETFLPLYVPHTMGFRLLEDDTHINCW